MNIFNLMNKDELQLLAAIADMYGVESDTYVSTFNELEVKYHNVVLASFQPTLKLVKKEDEKKIE